MLHPALTKTAIFEAIDHTCMSLAKQKHGPSEGGWTFRRAMKRDFQQQQLAIPTQGGRGVNDIFEEALLYGLLARSQGTVNSSDILVTFYFAYSTWDGKYVYLDHWPTQVPNAVQTLLYRALAQIAVRLKCARFTWQHYKDSRVPDIPQPTTLDGWLTLHWKADSICNYLKCQAVGPTTNKNELEPQDGGPHIKDISKVKDVIRDCLNAHSHDKFRARLATAQDVNHIGRLVQGLADFEKEPDAVHVTVDQYRQDGFEGQPLFYCLLLDHVNEDTSSYTCGMALCYMGYRLGDGVFLYLEDLFIEKEYRGEGAGTFIMSTLASIGYSLDCSRLVWQALDWNTPALTFYGGLGAKVEEGLLTTRFAGNQLKQFGDGDYRSDLRN